MVDLKAKPDANSQTLGIVYEDGVVEWLREVVGRNPYRDNQRWVETPQGYICRLTYSQWKMCPTNHWPYCLKPAQARVCGWKSASPS
jgi:hypothetical protein